MKILKYQTVKVFKRKYRHHDVDVKLIQAVSTGGSRDLPAYSNSPDSIYARIDQKTGRIESIRIYRNYKAFLDLDYHEGQKEYGFHWHYINFEKSGRSKQHIPAKKLKQEYFGELLDLLDKDPALIPLKKD